MYLTENLQSKVFFLGGGNKLVLNILYLPVKVLIVEIDFFLTVVLIFSERCSLLQFVSGYNYYMGLGFRVVPRCAV